MVIGSIPASSSFRAISIGLIGFSGGGIRIGAPIAICRALAPTIRALSKRVSFGGPTKIFFSEAARLILGTLRALGHLRRLHLSSGNNVVNL